MVVGGKAQYTDRKSGDTQVIDLKRRKRCKNLGNYPFSIEGASGAVMPNKDIIVCGGHSGRINLNVFEIKF